MALSQGSINSARAGAKQISSLSNSLKEAGENIKGILKGNGNYQYFRAGTDKGTSVDADLNLAVDTTIESLVPEISKVAGAIEGFCARQEELNRQEELRQQQEASPDYAMTNEGVRVTAPPQV